MQQSREGPVDHLSFGKQTTLHRQTHMLQYSQLIVKKYTSDCLAVKIKESRGHTRGSAWPPRVMCLKEYACQLPPWESVSAQRTKSSYWVYILQGDQKCILEQDC